MFFESFQRFIETSCPNACVPVDLVKIARNEKSNFGPRVEPEFRYKPPGDSPSPLRLVMDGECCLDRLYGGFFGDWVCGGQWSRMVNFLREFFEVANRNNVEITVFFNGALEHSRMGYWVEKQKSEKEKITQVLRHTSNRGTPPPKVWWIPPIGLRTYLRYLLPHLKVNVVQTTTEHHQEVMSYLREYNCHGLLADDPEYILFDPPRYFLSTQLKLTYKGCLETKEIKLSEVTRGLNLPPSRISIVAALLGNQILTEDDLAVFHQSLCSEIKGKITPNILIKSVVDYVRNLQSIDLNAVGWQVFGKNSEKKCELLKLSILYYRLGTTDIESHVSIINDVNPNLLSEREHLDEHRYRRTKLNKILSPVLETSGLNDCPDCKSNYLENSHLSNSNTDPLQMKTGEDRCPSKLPSETDESKVSSLDSFEQVVEKARHGLSFQLPTNYEYPGCDVTTNCDLSGLMDSISNRKENFQGNSMNISRLETAIESFSLKQSNEKSKKCMNHQTALPDVCVQVLRKSLRKHQKGLRHPFIFQILFKGEIKIPVTFGEDSYGELPSPALFFRPLRQMIYALLFNQHHMQYLSELKKEKEGIEDKVPVIVIKEWVWSHSNRYNKPDYVFSVPLGWSVPTIHRLWFSSGPEAKKICLHTFLTCMQSNSPLMCDPLYVPKHWIILCCVLRYMLFSPDTPFLHKYELDAFLVQAVILHTSDSAYTDILEVPSITPRGVLLAALFMNGVDHASMANDACGVPLSRLLCCPWLFFDGKLFHCTLLKAYSRKNLMDLCNNCSEHVSLVDRMRDAILDGVKPRFVPPQLPSLGSPPASSNYPVAVQSFPLGQGRVHQRVGPRGGHQPFVPRGGQLEVAGDVVESWSPFSGKTVSVGEVVRASKFDATNMLL